MRPSSLCRGSLAVVFLLASAGALSAQVDVPDPAFQDTNGDGIDGDIDRAIFVDDLSGHDSFPGTMAAPKRTIAAGIAAAQAAVPLKDVYVSAGTYFEAVSLTSGVSLYGQFARAQGWQRDPLFVTRIEPGPNGVLAQGLTAETHLEAFVIEAASPNGSGESSYAVRVRGGGGRAVIRYNWIEAGFGQAGGDGANGAAGINGTVGGPGGPGSCDGSTPGAGGTGGTNACSYGGGGGRGGAEGSNNGVTGSSGSGGTPGGTGGGGGDPGRAGGNGSNGGAGAQGPGGGAPPSLGTFVGGVYVPSSGSNGGSATHGRGGGGGGGGGGQGGTFVNDGTGNGGGGGGSAGCAGNSGSGGQGGGGSFAVLVIEGGRALVDHNTIVTGPGGAAGGGGDGGAGGIGANGGAGGTVCTGEVGRGGNGGGGGNGGRGGGGSGGAGGRSAGIFSFGGTIEPSGANKFSLGSGGAGGSGGAPNGASGPNGIQQAGGSQLAPPAIVIIGGTLSESQAGFAQLVFTVMLSDATDTTVTVDYATSDVTAQAGTDYTARSGRVTFNPWTSSQTISVPVLADALDEADETFRVNLGNPSGATIAVAFATGTITDDDGPPTASVGDVAYYEGNSGTTMVVFTVSLSSASGQQVTVDYATADGTALAGSDYQAVTDTVTFAPGSTAESVVVLVQGDTLIEPNEFFFLDLVGGTNVMMGDGRAVGIINDDDPADLIFRDGFDSAPPAAR